MTDIKQSEMSKILEAESSCTQLTPPKSNEGKKLPQFIAVTLATLAAFSAGLCISWSSPAIPMLKQAKAITPDQEPWVGSLLTLGAFSGAIPAGWMVTALGRKRTLQFLALPYFASWVLIAFVNSIYALYVARVFAGIAIGITCVATPMYVAELSEPSIRGSLGTFFQVQITIGLLLEYILGAVVTYQTLAILSAIPTIIFLFSFSFMPETPIFLYEKGHIEEAKQALSWFRGESCDIEEELLQIKESVYESQLNRARFIDVFKCKATSRGLIISLGLMLFQQLSGINVVLFYTDTIFSESGSSVSPAVSAIIVGAVQVVATLVSTLLIDKVGRRILLLTSSSIMALSLCCLGTYFHMSEFHDLSFLSLVPLLSLGLYIIVYSIGFGPIPWVMVGELFSPKMKGLAGAIAAAFSWAMSFLVTNQFHNLKSWLGMGLTFVLFAVTCSVAATFVFIILPETKGKTIDEVQAILLKRKRTECTSGASGASVETSEV